MIRKAYTYRIYPNQEQAEFLNNVMNINRYMFNALLEYWNMYYKETGKSPKRLDLQITELKNTPITTIKNDFGEDVIIDFSWLKSGISRPLELMLRFQFEAAWKKYFELCKSGEVEKRRNDYISKCKETGKKIKWNKVRNMCKPKFKSRFDEQSFQLDRGYKLYLADGLVKLPKLKTPIEIKISDKDKIFNSEFKPKTLTFKKNKLGHYFLTILVEAKEEPKPKQPIDKNDILGLDLGVRELVVCSDGEVFDNPKFLEGQYKKLKQLQRKASKQYRMNEKSENWKKTKRKIAKLQAKIANQRKNYTHNVTHKLVNSGHGSIAIEDLNVKGMTAATKPKQREDSNGFEQTGKKRKSGLNRSILDANLGEIRRQLTYKCEWEGVNLLVIDRFAPSSKTCNVCGFKNAKLKSKKTWTCPQCKTKHDRDLNASKNIANFAAK